MVVFAILSVVMIVGSLGVITLRQPVHAALSLVATLLTLAITYVTLQAHFLATVQVIVYAGAIMVLFLFVIMLLNIQNESQKLKFDWMRPVAYGVGALALVGIIISIFRNQSEALNMDFVRAALLGGGPAQIGQALFTEFILAFQLVGVLLLTGIIGAVSLVQRKAEEVYLPASKAAKAVANSALPAKAGGVAVLEGDDLKRIKGITPKLERLLHKNGIYTFSQIATMNESQVQALDGKLEEFKGRITRDNWIEQVKQLGEGQQ
ncbi:MAG: NADH-quinone oxidoreductase subunit J [Trueperaceae bacterium]